MTKPPATLTHEHFAQDEQEQVDPHGFGKGHHHGHTILPLITLRAVLVALLLLTGLTVLCAQGEQWIMVAFHIELPGWMNVAVALSIATVKSIIVAAYFMQLKYDNPINTVIFLFCLFALALFLGFTIIDLTGRDRVYVEKGQEIIAGGLGNVSRSETIDGKETTVSISGPIYKFPREKKLETVSPAEFAELEHEAHAASHKTVILPSPWKTNAANMSRSKSGPTGALDAVAPAPPAHEATEHGESH